jgi:tetratricopeptide (TPR) repeat protein
MSRNTQVEVARINAKQAIIVAIVSAFSGIIVTLISTGHLKSLFSSQDSEKRIDFKQSIPSGKSDSIGLPQDTQMIISDKASSYDIGAWGTLYFNDDLLDGLDNWLKHNALSNAASAEEHYARGRGFHQLCKHKEAAAEYREALVIRPTYLEAQYMLAKALMGLNNHEEATEKFEAVLKHDVGNFGAYYYLGVCWMKRGDFKQAKPYFQKVIELRPDAVSAHYNLGVCQLHLKDYKGSLVEFEHVSLKVPVFATAQFNKGVALFNLGRKEDALQAFKIALSLDNRLRLQLLANKEHQSILRDEEIGKRLQELLSDEYGQ